MARNERFNEECTEVTENKNDAYSKMTQRHKTRGIEERSKN
jgi:hypothetical protein